MTSGRLLSDGDQVVSLTTFIFCSMLLLLHLTYTILSKMLEAFDPLQCSLDGMLLNKVTPVIRRWEHNIFQLRSQPSVEYLQG